MKNFKIELIKFIESLNIFDYGFTECRVFEELREYITCKKNSNHLTEFEDKDVENRINPFLSFENGKTIISFAFPYLIEGENYNKYFSKYTQGKDYHYVVSSYLKKICDFIESRGYSSKYFCDTNNLPERYIAYLCGVGHIGKNSLLYTKNYGSYVFLGEIITDCILFDSENSNGEFYIEKFKDMKDFKFCGDCTRCLKSCPNDVLRIKNFNKCVSNLTQKKSLNDDEINNLNGMIFGCDVCQDSCPKNKNIKYSNIEDFKIEKFIEDMDDSVIMSMDNKYFKENFKKISCSWRGKNLLKRNVIIKNKNNIDFIRKLNLGNVEYLNYYKNKMLNEKK